MTKTLQISLLIVAGCFSVVLGYEGYTCHNETLRCFWISSQGSKSWDEGRTACQSEGGDLAVMETVEMFRFVQDSFSFSIETWIGLSDEEVESMYRWLNRIPLRYEEIWRHDQPNGQQGQNCAIIGDSSKQIQDRRCPDPYRLLCSNTSSLQCTEPEDGCGPVMTGFPNYQLSELMDKATWVEANETCVSMGLSLLTIPNQDKEDILRNQVDKEVWLGLTDMELEGQFRFVTNNYLITWANWKNDEPQGDVDDAPGLNDCVLRDTGDGTWKIKDCDGEQKHFYCERVGAGVESGTVLTDLIPESCLELAEPTQFMNSKNIHQLTVHKEQVDGFVTLNMTVADGNVPARCGALLGAMYSDVGQGPDCPGEGGNTVKGCRVLNPESNGPNCNVMCPCAEVPCLVKIIERKVKSGNESTLSVCEVE